MDGADAGGGSGSGRSGCLKLHHAGEHVQENIYDLSGGAGLPEQIHMHEGIPEGGKN